MQRNTQPVHTMLLMLREVAKSSTAVPGGGVLSLQRVGASTMYRDRTSRDECDF